MQSREPLLVVMAFAAGMMIILASQNIKWHAKNAENAKPAFPKEALTEAELNRWVVKSGEWPRDRATTPGLKREHRGVPVKRDGADVADWRYRKWHVVRSRQKARDHRERSNLGRVLKSTRRVGA